MKILRVKGSKRPAQQLVMCCKILLQHVLVHVKNDHHANKIPTKSC